MIACVGAKMFEKNPKTRVLFVYGAIAPVFHSDEWLDALDERKSKGKHRVVCMEGFDHWMFVANKGKDFNRHLMRFLQDTD